jgi:AcrR family transcriptional regulator
MIKKKSGGTKERLLTAASDVFVEKGFRNATVAEI